MVHVLCLFVKAELPLVRILKAAKLKTDEKTIFSFKRFRNAANFIQFYEYSKTDKVLKYFENW